MFIIATDKIIISDIIKGLSEIPSPLILIIIKRSIKTMGAAMTMLIYMSINVSEVFDCFSISSLYSKRRLWALFSKNSGRFPPEVIVVASPLNKSASFLLGLLKALFLNAVTRS
jgi:hypothetical protein